MDLKEIGQLSIQDEQQHWWSRTRFYYLENAIEQAVQRSAKDKLNILEMGCGSGANLRFLSSHSSNFQKLVGVDTALTDQVIEGLNLPDNITTVSCASKAPSADYDLLLAMDVLEHVEDDRETLNQWLEQIREKGYVFLTVPAFQSLWSQHDEILGHYRRYTKKDVISLTHSVGLKTIYCSYAFGYLVPPAYLIRKILRRGKKTVSTDLTMPASAINTTLDFIGKVDAWVGGNPVMGTSVVGLFQKID